MIYWYIVLYVVCYVACYTWHVIWCSKLYNLCYLVLHYASYYVAIILCFLLSCCYIMFCCIHIHIAIYSAIYACYIFYIAIILRFSYFVAMLLYYLSNILLTIPHLFSNTAVVSFLNAAPLSFEASSLSRAINNFILGGLFAYFDFSIVCLAIVISKIFFLYVWIGVLYRIKVYKKLCTRRFLGWLSCMASYTGDLLFSGKS